MLLEGKPVAEKIKKEIIDAVNCCKNEDKPLPKLAIMRVGERPDDLAYEEQILNNCSVAGILTEVTVIDNLVTMSSFMQMLDQLNQDSEIHGILIFRPLPEHLDIGIISRAIKPEKDIDCLNPINKEKIFDGDGNGFLPCTPEAVIEILKHYQYELTGKNVVIVNRSMVLGKPLSMMFLDEDATVTICHSKTKNLKDLTTMADIVVTGIGKGNFFGRGYFTEKTTVIDVGINFVNGKLCGDADHKQVTDQVYAITPVPGGIGTVTSMILLKHVIKAMSKRD